MESKKSKEVRPKKIRLNKAEQMIQKLDNWLDGCTYEREAKKSWWESLWKK